MTDRSSGGWLRIGGPFPAEHVPELAEMIESEGAQLDWGEEAITDAMAVLDACSALGEGPLALYGGEIPGGEYSELTDLLTAWGVPFVACWDGCEPSYLSGYKGLRPGGTQLIYSVATESGPAASLLAIKEAVSNDTVAQLVEELEFLTGDSLPPFVIAGPLGRAALAVSQTEDA